jgi:hypothetical protein
MQVQQAFRQIEFDLDPEARDRRSNMFSQYERTTQTGETEFTSRRGAKANEESEQEQRKR